MSLFSVTVPVTTDGSGAATAYSPPFVGFIHTVAVDAGTFALSGGIVDVLLTNETTGEAILTLTNMAGDVSVHPRTALQDDMGSDIENQYTEYFVNGRVKVEVAQGGDTKTGSVTIFVDGEGDAAASAFAARALTNPAAHTYADVSKPPYLSDGGGRETGHVLASWPTQEPIFEARNVALSIVHQPASVLAGQGLGPILVHILDAGGQVNPVNQSVTIALKQAGPVLSGTKTKATDEGIVVFDDLSIDQSGVYNLVVSTAGLPNVETSAFTSHPFAIAVDAVDDNTVGNPFSVSVEVVNASDVKYGEDQTTTATIVLNDLLGGGATLSGTLTETAVDGILLFEGLSIDMDGDYTVTVTCGSLSVVSNEFTIAIS